MAEDNLEEECTIATSVDSDYLEEDDEDEKYDREDGDDAYQQFEGFEYEALAERKRKALSDHQGDGCTKKARVNDSLITNFDEVIGNMKLGMRRKGRQQKKRGRRKGSKNKLSPEVSRKLGEANIFYAKGQYEDAIQVLKEVVMLAPNLSETYHTLGLVYEEIGDKKKSMNFYMLAVQLEPKDHPFLWKRIFALSIEQGNIGQAKYCLDKAIKADPEDISLRFNRATLYVELRNYQKAAELYHQLVELHPEDVDVCIMAATMYQKCNQVEQSVRILEDYISKHSSKADISATNLLVVIHMENRDHGKALQQFEHAHSSGKQLPISLTVKAGICQVHLGNIEEAKIHFSSLQSECAEEVADLIKEVAETYMNCGHYELALKYYFKLEGNSTHDNGFLHLRIARCYQSLMETTKAIVYFYKVLSTCEDNIDIRITLASLLVEEGKDDEAITLLSPPKPLEPTRNANFVQSRPWWDTGIVKKQLARIYLAKGMVEQFVDAIFPSISETLSVEYSNQKIRPRKTLPKSTLSERVKVLDDRKDDSIFQGFRPLATPSELLKASRARKSLQKKEAMREEKRAAALAAGLEWHSDDSDDEPIQTPCEPPLPDLLKDGEHYQLILDLCKALASLRRYWEALKIIRDLRKLASNTLSLEKKEELKSLEAQIAYNTTDSTCAHAEARVIVQRHPKSIAAWNYYYKVRNEKKLQKRSKFLNLMMRTDPKCVPPKIISGHRFTYINQHQEAARNYLEAYKLQPDNPLINLSVGTALINLALGLRVKNKHQCLAQGFAFLYNNLRLCQNSQEGLYNIARALQHIGLVTLAASYYEKALATLEKDYPIPMLSMDDSSQTEVKNPVYCNLRREAAYNLHLIYKSSGALDLARQVLRNYCTP